MSFGNWLNKEVKRIQDSYKQEEEQIQEAQAEEMQGDDIEIVMDALYTQGYWTNQSLEDDCDSYSVHPESNPDNVKTYSTKDFTQPKSVADVIKERQQPSKKADYEDPDEWVII